MASRGDIEAGRAFVRLFLKNDLTKQLNGVIGQARASLSQFSRITMTAGRALTKIGIAIGASYIAIASGNAIVAQKATLIHRTLANAIAPAVLPILERTLQIAQAFARWASHNQRILTLVLRTGLVLVTVGTGLKLAASMAKFLGAALQVVQLAVTAIGTMLATTWVGPLLLVLGTLVAIGAAAYYFSSTFRHFFQEQLASVSAWASEIRKSFASIGNALIDGRILLAWKILLAQMRMEWLRSFGGLTDTIAEFISGVVNKIAGLSGGRLISHEFADAFAETLKGRRVEAEAEMKAMLAQLNRLRGEADKREPFTPFSQAGAVKNAITAGGAAALTFGAGGQDVATKSYAELQAIKKAVWDALRLAKEHAARREKPGIFGP
jgi:hypothetical protein